MKPIKTILTSIALTAVAASGMLLAQPSHGSKLAAALNLNAQQQQQAAAIFQEERAASKPIAQALRQQRQAVKDAVAAGKPATEIQQLAQAEGQPMADLAAVRATAYAKLYAILTPDQQQALTAMKQQHRHKKGA